MNKTLIDTTAPVDFLSSSFLVGNVGAPFLVGLAVGYFAKKVLKVGMLLGGAAVVFMFITEYYGIIKVNDQGLQQAALTATDLAKQSGGFLVDRLSRITCKGVSAVTGFFVGMRMG